MDQERSGYSVFVGNFMVLDRVLFKFWLLGYTVDQTITNCLQFSQQKQAHPSSSTIKNFIVSQSFFHRPRALASQNLLNISHEAKSYLVTQYYSFDDIVVREFLGSKLSSRARKDLEEVSAKSRVPVMGCRRMFDNMKRIMKRVEDAHGDIVQIIMHDFLLPRDLAIQYSNIVFINAYRFETSRKRLIYLKFNDILFATNMFIEHLTTRNTNWAVKELDVDLAQHSRDILALIFNQKDTAESFKNQVIDQIMQQEGNTLERGQVNVVFSKHFKNLLSVVASLSHSKEQREIFGNILDKFVEPCLSMKWTCEDIRRFFQAILDVFSRLDASSSILKRKYRDDFTRILLAMQEVSPRFAAAYEAYR